MFKIQYPKVLEPNLFWDNIFSRFRKNQAGRVAQVIGFWTSKHEALNSNPSTTHKKKPKKQNKKKPQKPKFRKNYMVHKAN
jgi:hypothetical protein